VVVGTIPARTAIRSVTVLADLIETNRAFLLAILMAGSGPTTMTTSMMPIGLSTSQALGTIGLPSTSIGDTNFREKRDGFFATVRRGI